jgi:glycopeptide antibiotics resistance protein
MDSKILYKLTSKILFFSWLSAITFISLVDYSSIASIGGMDLSKGFGSGFWLHAVGYFIAGLLFILAFGKKGQAYLLIALTALFLLGVLFETAQLHIPKRTFNPVDIAANGLGLVFFYVCYNLTRIGRRRRVED